MPRGKALRLLALLLVLGMAFCTVSIAIEPPSRTVRVGFFPLDGFHEFSEDGAYTGYDYDYLMKIAEYTHWNYEFVVASWSECIQMLRDGEIDLLGAVQRTKEREEFLDFATLQSGMGSACLFTREDDLRYAYQDYSSFEGLHVGLLKGNECNAEFERFCVEKGFSVRLAVFDTQEKLIKALNSDAVEAILISNIRKIGNDRVIAEFSPTPYFYATTKGNTELLSELNAALSQIKSANVYFDYELYQHHYAYGDASLPVYSRAEQDFIGSCPPIPVALSTSHASLCRYDEQSGQFLGVTPDLMDEISRRSGLRFSYHPMPEGIEVIDFLRGGEARLAAPLMWSRVRPVPEGMLTSDAVLASSLVLIGKTEKPFSPEEPFVLALQKRFFNGEIYLRRLYPNATFHYFEDDQACLEALRDGSVDIMLDHLLAAGTRIQGPRYEGISVLSAYSFPEQLCIGALEGENPLLVSVLNKSIASLNENELNQIVTQNTFASSYQMTVGDLWFRFRVPVVVILVMVLLLFAALVIILMLRQRGSKRLEAANHDLREALAQKEAAYEVNRILEAQQMVAEKHRRELHFLADHDELTGIWNKRSFYRHIREILDKTPGERFLMIRGDIDRFKVYNDIYGIEAGDRLLIGIAALLRESILPGMLYCRLEGDHFALFCREDILPIDRMIQKIDHWFERYPSDFRFNACFGIYVVDDPSIDVDLMGDRALLALRTIKGKYGQRYAYYDEMLRDRLMLEQEVVSSMTVALTNGEFEVYFQPQYCYTTNALIGAEALVRWNHPRKGMISPTLFIPIFEKNGFVFILDQYVWEQSCRLLSRWIHQEGCHPVPVSVNISRIDICDPGLCQILVGLIERYKIPASMLKLEITESAYVDNPVQLISVVEQLHQSGFCVQMDDFGSGYSSLNTLKDVPVDLLKLDLKFLGGEHNVRSGNILSSVVRMARWLDLQVIAEGVETKQQADFLSSIGCEQMQGYFFAAPMSAEKFEKLLCRAPLVGQAGQAATPEALKNGLIDTNEFWDPESQTARIFHSYVGGAAILEFTEGRVEALRINERFFETVNLTREEFQPLRLNLLEWIMPPDRQRFLETLHEAIASQDGNECEFRCRAPQPGVEGLWLQTRVRLIAHKGESFVFYALIENITRQRTLEQQLEAIMTSLPGGVALYEVGEQVRTLYFNDRTAAILGYSRENYHALYAEDALSIIYEEDRDLLMKKVEELQSGRTDQIVCTYRAKHNAGGLCWIRLSGAVMRREEGRIYVSAIFFDINEEILMQRERELTRFGSALISAFDEVIEVDMAARSCSYFSLRHFPKQEEGGIPASFDALSARWLKRIDSRDQERVRAFLDFAQEDRKSEEPHAVFYRLLDADLQEKWCACVMVQLEKGKYLCYNRAVTGNIHREIPVKASAALLASQREQERYRIIVEQMGAAVFDWNFTEEIFYTSKRYRRYLISQLQPNQLMQCGPDPQAVFPDDFPLVERIFTDLREGRSKAEVTLRLKVSGEFRWSRLSLYVVSRDDGEIHRVIGWVEDIQEQREQELALRAKAEYDAVTGLCNRATAVEQITRRLQKAADRSQSVLIIIDVDNFKGINDRYGHPTGDRLLSSLGELIRSCCRETDVVGRMGGDEFIMLLGRIPLETAIEKLQHLEHKIHLLAKKLAIKTDVSVSMGLCRASDADGSFEDTFERADQALYRAKSQGKDRIGIYRRGEQEDVPN